MKSSNFAMELSKKSRNCESVSKQDALSAEIIVKSSTVRGLSVSLSALLVYIFCCRETLFDFENSECCRSAIP